MRRDPPALRALYICISCVILGGILLAFVSETIEPIFVALIIMLAGASFNLILPNLGGYPQRAFLLSFGACVLVAGLAQIYSQEVFHMPTTTVDATNYWHTIDSIRHVSSMRDIPNINAPLAIFIWARILYFSDVIGLHSGLWIPVLFNSLLVGISANLAVRASWHVFGNDSRRLHLMGTLFALCGMFWLFGALLLRGAFLLFINTFFLWALLRTLNRTNIRNLLLAFSIGIFTIISFYFLRRGSVPLVLAFVCAAFLSLVWEKRNVAKLFIIGSILIIVLIIFQKPIAQFLSTSQQFFLLYSESYTDKVFAATKGQSLFYTLIMSQPLYIRIPFSAFMSFIFPLPLWAYMHAGAMEYHLIKTWQGFFLVAITPLIILGAMELFRHARIFSSRAKISMFILLYSVIAIVAVSGTSSETRHYGQFMPALLLMAAVPNINSLTGKKLLKSTQQFWFGIVVLLHLAWGVLKIVF